VRAVGCAPGEMLHVGDDRANDYDGALAAGLRAVLLQTAGKQNESAVAIAELAALLDR